ncbi:glycosyltransferase [Terriglobus sp. YAF25]|uniref:glycosyltransferase n=1 Tax=Terriglobus sp. YAF25 TaxID=3233080 RepID=UPI003F9C16AA
MAPRSTLSSPSPDLEPGPLRIAGAVDHAVKPVFDRLPNASVEWLGPVPQSDLITLMSKSHVLVLPSIEEGLALVQAQAMACGCPVIASHNTGSEDLYTDGVEGFIVPIRDAASLADRMQRIADDPGMHQRMREASLNRVRHLGGWSEYGAKWEKILQELLAAKS